MDDDCMRLLLGEEGEECRPAPSSGGSVSTCGGGSAMDVAAHADSAAQGEGGAAEEEEELLLEGVPLLRNDDPSVVLSRDFAGAPACLPAASPDRSTKCCLGSDSTTLSTGLGAEEEGARQATPLQRAKSGASKGAAPYAKPLYGDVMLSMDYQSAVESINLQLTCGESRLAEDSLSESVLPISLATGAGAKTPTGPDLLSPAIKWWP